MFLTGDNVLTYDASSPKHIKKALKALKAQEAQDAGVIQNIMSSPAGRTWMHNLLAECHVFGSSFNLHAGQMSFNEGERNVGLKLFLAVVKHCPDPYIQMMREANDRSSSNDEQPRGPSEGNGRDSSGADPDAYVDSDYNPIDASS